MIDTYITFDKVEAWQLEVGDPATLDGEHYILTGISDTDDSDEVFVTGISEETGDETSFSLYWSQEIDLWKVSEDE